MTIDPKILIRIQKLLSLGSNNDQTHEAEAAMKKAAELAEEHGLALSDVNQETGEVKNINRDSVSLTHQRHNCWSLPLAEIVGNCFDCRTIIVKNPFTDNKMVFIGTSTDLEMAVWYYKLIRLKTIRGASSEYTLVADQKMYGRGVIKTMRTRLEEMFKKVQEEIRTETTTALILVKNDAVDKEVKKQFPHLRSNTASYKMSGNMSAYKKGIKDGETMGLNRGNIEGNKTRQIA